MLLSFLCELVDLHFMSLWVTVSSGWDIMYCVTIIGNGRLPLGVFGLVTSHWLPFLIGGRPKWPEDWKAMWVRCKEFRAYAKGTVFSNAKSRHIYICEKVFVSNFSMDISNSYLWFWSVYRFKSDYSLKWCSLYRFSPKLYFSVV